MPSIISATLFANLLESRAYGILRPAALGVQRQRLALRGLRGRWRQNASRCTSGRRHGALRGLPRAPLHEATLRVKYKDKSIADVLDLPIAEARELFANHNGLRQVLIRCWMSAWDIWRSGSRHRRCQAAKHSASSCRANSVAATPAHTLYLLDEPTTGLHFDDIRRLLSVLSPGHGRHRAGH